MKPKGNPLKNIFQQQTDRVNGMETINKEADVSMRENVLKKDPTLPAIDEDDEDGAKAYKDNLLNQKPSHKLENLAKSDQEKAMRILNPMPPVLTPPTSEGNDGQV